MFTLQAGDLGDAMPMASKLAIGINLLYLLIILGYGFMVLRNEYQNKIDEKSTKETSSIELQSIPFESKTRPSSPLRSISEGQTKTVDAVIEEKTSTNRNSNLEKVGLLSSKKASGSILEKEENEENEEKEESNGGVEMTTDDAIKNASAATSTSKPNLSDKDQPKPNNKSPNAQSSTNLPRLKRDSFSTSPSPRIMTENQKKEEKGPYEAASKAVQSKRVSVSESSGTPQDRSRSKSISTAMDQRNSLSRPILRPLGLVVAIKAYTSPDPTKKMSFAKGDLIRVYSNAGMWHKGVLHSSTSFPTITKKMLYFPSNFVKPFKKSDPGPKSSE